MIDDTRIEIWERVKFKGSEAVEWERSFDGGQTWEPVSYQGSGGLLPFVRLDGGASQRADGSS